MKMTANTITTHHIHLAFAFIIINIIKIKKTHNKRYYLGQEMDLNRAICTSTHHIHIHHGLWHQSTKKMKDEVLNDTKHGLTIIEYDNTVLKARMKRKAMSGTVKGSDGDWKIVYEIPEGSPIKMKHILAVLLYTNHTDLSAAFSRSFRKISGSESDNKLKERHSHYANWARLLREAVECWGSRLWDTTQRRSIFYHGI
eukprot:973108_1